MRILHVNKFFDLHGGAEVYMHRLMKAQAAAGHEVHAFSTVGEKNLPALPIDSKNFVTRFALDKGEAKSPLDIRRAANYLWNCEAKAGMERAIKDVRPDVIHVHNIYHHLSTSVLAPIRKSGIPCVQTLHDYKVAGCPNYMMFTQGKPCERCKGGNYLNAVKYRCLFASPLPNLLAALEMGMVKTRRSYEKTVRLFLCPSRFMKEKMEDWGMPSNKLRYVPNPTELSDAPVPRGGGYLLFAGRLSIEKGLMSFLEAAWKIPELPIKIVGRGQGRLSDEERIRSFVREKGAHHVEFLGFQLPTDLAQIRRRAEALISPSVSYDNAPLSVLEAMADGLPVLASRIGGIPELIEDGVDGLLANPNDSDDWLRVLRRFQALPTDVRQAMGDAGRERIKKNFLWSQNLERVMSCYEEAGARI